MSTAGKVEADAYRYVCEKLVEKFPNLKTVAITLRGSISASHNTWSGVLWRKGAFLTGNQVRYDPHCGPGWRWRCFWCWFDLRLTHLW